MYSLDFGRISVIAKGSLRPKSQFYGKLELLNRLDISLSRREGREMDTATEADVKCYYQDIRCDPVAFTHACLFVEWLLLSISGSEPSHPMFHLIGNVLDSFAQGPPFWPVLCAGLEKTLRLNGFGMEIEHCTKCGEKAAGLPYWNPASGGLVCGKCSGDSRGISPGLLAFFRKSRNGSIEDVRKIKLWHGGYRQCFDLLRDFAEIHLERRMNLKSLSVLEDLENEQ